MSDIIKAELARRGYRPGEDWELPCRVIVRMKRGEVTIHAAEDCTDLEGELANFVLEARIREWRNHYGYTPDGEERAFAQEFEQLYVEQPKSELELNLERLRLIQGANGYD